MYVNIYLILCHPAMTSAGFLMCHDKDLKKKQTIGKAVVAMEKGVHVQNSYRYYVVLFIM
jgi:hypothetical protein